MHHEETIASVDSKNGKGVTSSKISGDENDGLKMSFRSLLQAHKNDVQKHVIKTKKAYLKVNKFAIPRKSLTTNTNTKCSQDCDVVPIKGSSDKSSRHEQQISKEAQQDIDAAKEIESLMYKDYNNKGKPSHRPPINNHEPNNP
ncbi:hypothetical protein TSUD_168700 [Trifolium subterraneum]|nr:hypothetical protein TSUD_168700 [Trifolium subterraneum]